MLHCFKMVPLAFLLSRYTGLGENGIWLALNLGYVVQLGLMWWRYRLGRWKGKRIWEKKEGQKSKLKNVHLMNFKILIHFFCSSLGNPSFSPLF